MAAPQVNYGGQTLLVNDITMGVTEAAGESTVSGYANLAFGKIKVASVNFNAGTTDTSVSVHLPVGVTTYKLKEVLISNASHTLVTATIGVFTAAGGTGTTLLADSAITVATGTVGSANSSQTLAGVSTVNTNVTTLYVRIGTAEGAAATGDVYLILEWL